MKMSQTGALSQTSALTLLDWYDLTLLFRLVINSDKSRAGLLVGKALRYTS